MLKSTQYFLAIWFNPNQIRYARIAIEEDEPDNTFIINGRPFISDAAYAWGFVDPYLDTSLTKVVGLNMSYITAPFRIPHFVNNLTEVTHVWKNNSGFDLWLDTQHNTENSELIVYQSINNFLYLPTSQTNEEFLVLVDTLHFSNKFQNMDLPRFELQKSDLTIPAAW